MSDRPVLEPTEAHPITVQPTGKHVTVRVNGELVAETDQALTLQESTYPAVQYIPLGDVVQEMLQSSDTETYCPYKGTTSDYWSARIGDVLHADVAWSYAYPSSQVLQVAGLVAFYDEKVDTFLDGVAVEQPRTKFSGDGS